MGGSPPCPGEPLTILAPKSDGKPLEGSEPGSDMTQLWFPVLTPHCVEEETDSEVDIDFPRERAAPGRSPGLRMPCASPA